ncbi:MAG: rRNA cytosine-C5-methyltransferase, partial [Nocardioides sp.]|nr:rRNA cytosine-C5-methyltransferase [Nocardioides sp.]
MADSRRRRRADRSRLAALEVLRAVRVDDAYANLVLPRVLARHGLAGRDAALATELASGTLRWQGLYDAVIDACLTKPRLQPEVRDVLRLGVHQLLAMRVPDHAAISTSVDLVVESVGRGPSGLVNAVLRKVASRSREEWIGEVAPSVESDRIGHLSLAWSHPRWVVEELDRALGSPDELATLLEADNAPPRVTLVARPGLATVVELVDSGAVATPLSRLGAELPGGDPSSVP